MILRLFLFSLAFISITACGVVKPYKFDIPQGNEIEQTKLDQLKIGMTESQVVYLLGNPSIKDLFSENRWDYAYYLTDKKRKVNQRLLTLKFEAGKLASIDDRYSAAKQ